MALLDDVRTFVRVKSTATDVEIQLLIDAAREHMRTVGVRDSLIDSDPMDPMVQLCVMLHAKANYGLDNNETSTWWPLYIQNLTTLLNSSKNECAEDESSTDDSTDTDGDSTDESVDGDGS